MMDAKRILIVEDDLLIQMVYKALFAKKYDIRLCCNDKDFYEALTDKEYDLFIVDLSLQCEKDGIQLIKELREIDKYKHTPVLVVTAFGYSSDRINAFNAGASEYLTKPATNQVLRDTVSSLLNEAAT